MVIIRITVSERIKAPNLPQGSLKVYLLILKEGHAKYFCLVAKFTKGSHFQEKQTGFPITCI